VVSGVLQCPAHRCKWDHEGFFYVEPYEKSLAKDLHDDAIAFEIEESKDAKPKRVEFLHFEGVAIFILDQVGADRLAWPCVDFGDSGRQFSGNLNAQACPGVGAWSICSCARIAPLQISSKVRL